MEEKVVVKRPPKSPGLAGVLAFFFPFGVGQLYNEQYRKALIFFLVFAGLVTLNTHGDAQPFMGLAIAGFYFYQIFEAVQTSKQINRIAMQLEEKKLEVVEEFPEAIRGGSIFWGIFIMAIGGILLLANFDVIEYDALWDYWPVLVIVIGFKLIMDYFMKNGEKS